MKKTIGVAILVAMLVACGSPKVINGKRYETCGLINKDDCEDKAIRYSPCWGNIIWGSFLVETLIAPIYFFGFSMFNPEGPR
jgi:hypothetical protein